MRARMTRCPSCRSRKIQHVTRDWQGNWKGQSYTVPALEYWDCPACGEKVFSPEAIRRIQSVSAAYRQKRARRRAAAAR